MPITNSFHSSAKKHAIGSAAKLKSCELHNDRGYYSFYYDKNKISNIVGSSETLYIDTEKFINETFAELIDTYNEKQKRQDRKITTSAFDYFCGNKKLDIATEAIFQLGDKAFWDKYRIDNIFPGRKGEIVLKDFPDNVKEVMNDIFKKQGQAYEKIYETHGDQILAKIEADKIEAQKTIDALSDEERTAFENIQNNNLSDRKDLISKLQDPNKYFEYTEAAETLATIKKLKIEDRIKNNQMHIKLTNQVGHYDEFSPHAHGISVCWADGYERGLPSRLAKSVVLNKWTLSVIQDRLHEIALEEIEQHPEIFSGENLVQKQIGRNLDYSTEQILRKHQQDLIAQKDTLQTEISTMVQEGKETIAQYRTQSLELEAEIEQLQGTQFKVLNELHSIIENSAETLNDMVEQSIDTAMENSNGSFENALFYLTACSNQELEYISEQGLQLKKELMHENVDASPMQVGLDNLIQNIQKNNIQMSWEERQKFWDTYNEMTNEFWSELPELQKSLKGELNAEYNKLQDALRSYSNAYYLLRRTRNIFVMLYAAIRAFIASGARDEALKKINTLKNERQQLIRATASFKKYSNYYREELKSGNRPCEKYLNSMTNILQLVDKEAAKNERATIPHRNNDTER